MEMRSGDAHARSSLASGGHVNGPKRRRTGRRKAWARMIVPAATLRRWRRVLKASCASISSCLSTPVPLPARRVVMACAIMLQRERLGAEKPTVALVFLRPQCCRLFARRLIRRLYEPSEVSGGREGSCEETGSDILPSRSSTQQQATQGWLRELPKSATLYFSE